MASIPQSPEETVSEHVSLPVGELNTFTSSLEEAFDSLFGPSNTGNVFHDDGLTEEERTEFAGLLIQGCSICMEEKQLGCFPSFPTITTKCRHPTQICLHCLQKWLDSELNSMNWDKLRCSVCAEILQCSDIKACATLYTFKK
jgi:hypothetical protein